jgi:hypothetical protein
MISAAPFWAPSRPWTPAEQPPYPPEPQPGPIGCTYDRATPPVYQTADWTCSCASSAWLLNSVGDDRLGKPWDEWDVVEALRAATYPGAVTPDYGLARADMYDLEVMFNTLGYTVQRRQHLSVDDVVRVAGIYPMQVNGARWYHHSGARALGPGLLYLANPSPNWKGVGQEMDSSEAASWGTWNGLWITGKGT